MVKANAVFKGHLFMQAMPHQYHVNANAKRDDNLVVSVTHLPDLTMAAPQQFGGPGDKWSPEDMLMASISSCFILSFKAIARASKFDWVSIECHSQGTLDRVDGVTQFTKVVTDVTLMIPETENKQNAEKLLHKADKICLVAISLHTEIELKINEIRSVPVD